MMELNVSHLNFSYGEKKVLKDINLTVKDGEFVSILGPSGCGKSTLLNLIAGILPYEDGGIYLNDQPLRGICKEIAYMPQEDLLFPWRTILDNVTLYGEIHGKKEEARRQALASFERFGLAGCEDLYPEELSGGMRQRAAFLRTALCEAGIFLLDEPFGALDIITRNDMQDWLYAMRKELKRTILLVTHDTDEAIYLSDRIVILGDTGEGIREEISIPDTNRDREWLYARKDLRLKIHDIIRGC